MFKAVSRKRPSTDFDCSEPQRSKSQLPLHGVIVCLSGLPEAYKMKLHQMVNELGGAYTRHLDTSQNTHLIACIPEGDKYETAKTCPLIHIVKPEWLEQSAETGVRANEENYSIVEAGIDAEISLEESLEVILKSEERSRLFASCSFYPIGFHNDSCEFIKLSKLIRRGMGTNYWELNEVITHIIVQDECDDVLIEAGRTVTLHHPNGPAYVSPRWVVASWKAQQLLSPLRYEPRKRKEIIKSANPTKAKSRRISSELFRGSVFCTIRIAPPDGCIDWDSEALESIISTHGGQMISSKLLDALRLDQSSHDPKRRTLYMVCWGGYTPLHATLNPILAHIRKEDLCSIVPVNPIWLKTSIAEQKIIISDRRPLLFQPQPWPYAKVIPSIIISLTGFTGSERTGIMQLIETLGATYTANLKPQNTHLICKEAKGPKFDKAMEWSLYVVNVNWLYHIARYGASKIGGSNEKMYILSVVKENSSLNGRSDDGRGGGVREFCLNSSEVNETQTLLSQDN